jgi:hypothetical protein
VPFTLNQLSTPFPDLAMGLKKNTLFTQILGYQMIQVAPSPSILFGPLADTGRTGLCYHYEPTENSFRTRFGRTTITIKQGFYQFT